MPQTIQELLDVFNLEQIEPNLFRGGSSPHTDRQRVFGGDRCSGSRCGQPAGVSPPKIGRRTRCMPTSSIPDVPICRSSTTSTM